MKAKLKSSNKLSGLLLAHGEKLGMAAVLVVAALLIKSSLGRERLPEEKFPSQLASKAADATRNYEEMKWENFPKEERVDVAMLKTAPGGGVMKPVNDPDFPIFDTPFDPPVVPPVGLRTDPDLLAPQKLEVHAASGLWAFDNPEMIKKRALEAVSKAQRRQKEEEERQREEEQDMERGRNRRDRDYGGEGYRDRGGYGMGGVETTVDNVAVIRPNMAATPEGIADIRNQSWVMVVGKVPIKAQAEKYKDALANASGYSEQSDMPKYIGYTVERAEVTVDGQQKWAALPNVHKRLIIQAMEARPIEPPELADPKYTHPLLTWPLPPMVLRPWGEEVTHSDLPIPTAESMYEEQMAAAEAATEKPEEGEEEGDEFAAQMKREAAAAAPMQGEYGRSPYGEQGPMEFGRGGMEMGRGGYGGEFGRGGGGYGGEFGRGGYGEMAMGRGAGAYENLPDKPWDMVTKYYLFRYVDDTVEPGLRYRYRVKLALADVNSDSPERRVAERYLDPTVGARKAEGPKDKAGKPLTYRFTDWSEPSPVAAVPQTGLIYVATVAPANPGSVSSEPEALVLVKTLDADNVAEVGLAAEFLRGGVVNILKHKAQIIWSASYQLNVDPDEEERPSPEFDFVTGVTLLDFTGGEKLGGSRELLAPARALVMDATGRMAVEEELDDLLPVREYNMVMENLKAAQRNRQDEGRDDRGGDRRRRGGGGRGRR